MANTLKIYKTQLTPARNALIDDIEEYLENIEDLPEDYTGTDALTYSDANFQYVKPDLDISIKVNMPIDNNSLFDSIGNYVRIEQAQVDPESQEEETTAVWYYFIVGSKWISQGTIQLDLSLDTINTFGEYLLDEDNWSDKTSIIRQHEPRFKRLSTTEFAKSVNKVGEGIDIPVLYKTDDNNIEEPNSTGVKEWYLVYKTDAAAISEAGADASQNALNCYIYPKTPIIYQQYAGTPGSLFWEGVGNFDDGYIYGITRGSIRFQDVIVKSKYRRYKDQGITVRYGSNDARTFNKPKLSCWCEVGYSFTRNGVKYTCYAIVWYKNTKTLGAGYMSIPVGLFKSNKENDDKVYYALYLNTVDDRSYYEWFFVQREVVFLFGWEVGMCFSYQPKPYPTFRGLVGGGTGSNLKDTNNKSDDWAVGRWDTNWARSAIICDNASIQFTEVTDFIYQLPYENKTPTKEELVSGNKFISNAVPGVNAKLSCIDFLDKTDSTLVKILALPYCPTEISISSGSIESGEFTISFDTDIINVEAETAPGYTNYFRLKYTDKKYNFGKYLDTVSLDYTTTDDFLNYFYNNVLDLKNIDNETKLLHSDYLKDTFVYDNVSKTIRQEDISADSDEVTISTFYQPTNTLSSTMLYKFDINNADYTEITDWDRVLVSTRNNELPIYNNDYLNYMRYGYSTDKANLEATAKAQRQSYNTNSLLSVVGGFVGGAVGGATTIGGGLIGATIGAITGTAAGIAKAVSSVNTTETAIKNAQRSLESKVNELAHTATTVENGASAVDLMTSYTDNRLHHMTYAVPEIMKEALYDKFFYCGYNCPIQQKPALNTRLSFNFVQCDPVFVNESQSVYSYYLDDIKDRFKTGVTIYHDIARYLEDLDTDELIYDWDQKYENWENFERIIPSNYNYEVDDNSPYALSYDWIEQTGQTEVYDQFEPAADNNYRWKLTYTKPGDTTVYDYPYASAADRTNGYTLSTTVNPYSDFSGLFFKPNDGTVINLSVVDIADPQLWSPSESKQITVNCAWKYDQSTDTFTRNKDDSVITYLGNTYYPWKSDTLPAPSTKICTLSQTPLIGDDVYGFIQVGGNWSYTILGQITELTTYQ